jgi:hypothetical protein
LQATDIYFNQLKKRRKIDILPGYLRELKDSNWTLNTGCKGPLNATGFHYFRLYLATPPKKNSSKSVLSDFNKTMPAYFN